MKGDVSALLQTLNSLIGQLSCPVDEDLKLDGWIDESAEAIRSRLESFRAQIELNRSLPPPPERPLNMVRALDHWGVTGGRLAEDLALLEHNLRSA